MVKKKKMHVEEKEASVSPDADCFVSGALSRRARKRSSYKKEVCKREGELDTNVFERHLESLWRRLPEHKKNSFAYFDCLWYSMYTSERGVTKAKVLEWIKRKNVFSRTYVLVPIVQWRHWSLLILCHFDDSSQSSTRTPCMLLLDSLQMASPRRLESGIRKFVFDILSAEGRIVNKKVISNIPLLVPKVPQQMNGEECGNYVLYFINLFVENAPENFSIDEGYPYFMKEDWFSSKSVETFFKKLGSASQIDSVVSKPCNECDTPKPDYCIERVTPKPEHCSERATPKAEHCNERATPKPEHCSERPTPKPEHCSERPTPKPEHCDHTYFTRKRRNECPPKPDCLAIENFSEYATPKREHCNGPPTSKSENCGGSQGLRTLRRKRH